MLVAGGRQIPEFGSRFTFSWNSEPSNNRISLLEIAGSIVITDRRKTATRDDCSGPLFSRCEANNSATPGSTLRALDSCVECRSEAFRAGGARSDIKKSWFGLFLELYSSGAENMDPPQHNDEVSADSEYGAKIDLAKRTN